MSAHREMEKSSAMTNPGSELERRKTKNKADFKIPHNCEGGAILRVNNVQV